MQFHLTSERDPKGGSHVQIVFPLIGIHIRALTSHPRHFRISTCKLLWCKDFHMWIVFNVYMPMCELLFPFEFADIDCSSSVNHECEQEIRPIWKASCKNHISSVSIKERSRHLDRGCKCEGLNTNELYLHMKHIKHYLISYLLFQCPKEPRSGVKSKHFTLKDTKMQG